MGGIWNAGDALEFILAGASAVAIGTVLYADPAAGNRVVAGIRAYMETQGVGKIGELIGAVKIEP
jgi:dihydroorotate dehydrogenase (NAD+) catalytic subunit